MNEITRLILKRPGRVTRWEQQQRGDYDLEGFDREFQERLYSEKGREMLRAWEQRRVAPGVR